MNIYYIKKWFYLLSKNQIIILQGSGTYRGAVKAIIIILDNIIDQINYRKLMHIN